MRYALIVAVLIAGCQKPSPPPLTQEQLTVKAFTNAANHVADKIDRSIPLFVDKVDVILAPDAIRTIDKAVAELPEARFNESCSLTRSTLKHIIDSMQLVVDTERQRLDMIEHRLHKLANEQVRVVETNQDFLKHLHSELRDHINNIH